MQLDHFFPKPQRTVTLFAAAQLQGARDTQEDYFLNFNEECIALADGVGGMPHGEVAAQLACETAIWGYKEIRLRNSYWNSKKLLVKRIFRSTNLTVWQKQREKGFTDGMATTLTLVVVGEQKVWVGAVGDSPAYLFHQGKLQKTTHDDIDAEGYLTKTIGTVRYGLTPQVTALNFANGDAILLVTDGVTHFVSEGDIEKTLLGAGSTTQSLTDAVVALLHLAEKQGSSDNLTACLIKRIRN